jgi:hypothetical protein
MNPIRRELLNGLFVLVLSTLLSAGFAAFQVKFDVQLLVWILLATAIAVAGYVVFEFVLSAEARERASEESTRRREEEWLKRVGNPAHLDYSFDRAGVTPSILDATRAMKPGSDLTFMTYVGSEGGRERVITEEARRLLFSVVMEQLKRRVIREYKRLLCFDYHVLENTPELKSGILRVGEGPGTISRQLGEQCRLMMETKGCSLYVAPAILKNIVGLFGTDTVSVSLETADQQTGARSLAGIMLFYDPPNGEIIEQFRQIERDTERHMVAVHKIRFPEDAAPKAEVAAR